LALPCHDARVTSLQEVPASDYVTELELASRALIDANLAAVERMEMAGPVHLRALQCLDGLGSGNVSALADALDMLPSTASRLSDRLTAAGLITRTVSPVNRRATLLQLTHAGREVLAELARVRGAALAEIAERMTEGERAALLAGLRAFDRVAGRARKGSAGPR
jgi:DNA-binding MarR family transcriptional regulator